MEKRELSNTLRNLKFMQRAAQREEQPKKAEVVKPSEETKPDGNFSPSITINRKCVILMEGDPHPGALKGRMSFQSFNPSIDKLNEEEVCLPRHEVPTCSLGNDSEKFSLRENGSSRNGAECSNNAEKNRETLGDLKRKESEMVSAAQHPTKFPKSVEDNRESSFNNSRGFFKKPKVEKLNWNVLRPSKSSNKRGG